MSKKADSLEKQLDEASARVSSLVAQRAEEKAGREAQVAELNAALAESKALLAGTRKQAETNQQAHETEMRELSRRAAREAEELRKNERVAVGRAERLEIELSALRQALEGISAALEPAPADQ
jgi:hypothetical protein